MSNHYTDAEVEIATEAFNASYYDGSTSESFEAEARDLLNAVAPAIAARALREAADAYTWPSGGASKARPWARTFLRERADEIEGQP